jgi:hypothetical protein
MMRDAITEALDIYGQDISVRGGPTVRAATLRKVREQFAKCYVIETMKLTSIERKLAKLEAEVDALSSRRKPMLQAVVDDRDPAGSLEQVQERALAEHITAHPEDRGLTVADFDWSLWTVIDPRRNSAAQNATDQRSDLA